MKIDVTIPPAIERSLRAFSDSGPASPLNVLRAMIQGVKDKVRLHLENLAETKHTTADRLGASYTGFYATAARGVQEAATSVNGEEGGFVLTTPGLSRAFQSITIVPKNGAQNIPIPLNAMAYGKSPREFEGQPKRFIKKGAGGGSSDKPRKVLELDDSIPAWLLVPSVTQPQDPSLFPDARALKIAAIDAAMEVIHSV